MGETIYPEMTPVILILIAAIGVYALWIIIREKRSGYALADERTAKIQGKAATVSFTIGAWYLILLNFYNMYRIIYQGLDELSSMLVINSAVILMGITHMVLIAYFNRKEDV
jgi:hypothetical protein